MIEKRWVFSGGKFEEFGNKLLIRIRGLLHRYVFVEKWVEIKVT